jgi:peroxiredoxin
MFDKRRRIMAKRSFSKAAWLALAAIVACSATVYAAKFNTKVDIGDKAPTWQKLQGVDGKEHGLGDLKDAKLVVVVFTCNECPVAQAYEERFNHFVADYKDKGVEFVAINPNDSLDVMKQRAETEGLKFPYLRDDTQETSRSFGATVTPHVFILDKDREIAYMGAFDNNMETGKADKHYVKDAVDSLLKGEEPQVTETKQSGCGIKYKKG